MNILVSTLVNLGDVIMMTSALDILRKLYPDATIDVLARKDALPILENNPLINDVVLYSYKSGSFLHGFNKTLQIIKHKNYDIYISLDRRPRSAALAWLARIPIRIGPSLLFGNSRPRWWIPYLYTQVVSIAPEECHGNALNMFQLVVHRAFNTRLTGNISLPPVPSDIQQWAKDFFQTHAEGKTIIGLCVRTNHPLKNWSMERFALLIRQLHAKGTIFLYITGDSNDRDPVQAMLDTLPTGVAVNMTGKTSLMELRALTTQSRLFITLDNGAAHIVANSGGAHMICIFGCTEPGVIADSISHAEMIWSQNEVCRPCKKTPETCQNPVCLSNISVDQVYQAALRLLTI